jgi:putative solute:sodium symporter small subunit
MKNHATHDPATAKGHWPRLRRMTMLLLLAWFLITVLSIWFARELSGLVFFGWPLSFYLAAQGTLLGFLAIVGLYAWLAGRLESRQEDRLEDRLGDGA